MFNSVQSVCNLKYTIKIAFLQQINNFAPENELKIFDIFDVFFQKVDFCRPKPSHPLHVYFCFHTSHEQNSFFHSSKFRMFNFAKIFCFDEQEESVTTKRKNNDQTNQFSDGVEASRNSTPDFLECSWALLFLLNVKNRFTRQTL